MDVFDIARFWSKVDVRSESECWPWRSGMDGNGYGQFRLREGGIEGAHRIAFSLFSQSPISELVGVVVRHGCDTPSCCNPFHLSTGTHADNVADRVSRKRSAKGEGNGHHVLTEREVRAIMADPRQNAVIARDYHVHTDTIRCIKIGKTWKHLFTDSTGASSDSAEDHQSHAPDLRPNSEKTSA